jgi:hypothetical protein
MHSANSSKLCLCWSLSVVHQAAGHGSFRRDARICCECQSPSSLKDTSPLHICLNRTESCTWRKMLPGVVLPVRNTGSYSSNPHIVRTGGHKHRCGPFHLPICSHACEQKFVGFESFLRVQSLDLNCEGVTGCSHQVCHFSLTFFDMVDQFVCVRKWTRVGYSNCTRLRINWIILSFAV